MNPKIDSVSGVEDTHLRLFRGGFTFLRLSLPKISNGFGGLPEWVVECAIQTWCTVHRECLCHTCHFLRKRGTWVRSSLPPEHARIKTHQSQRPQDPVM